MLRKLLIVVFLLPVLAYGGAKGYLWYSIYSTMDDLTTSLSAFANLEYKDIRAPLTAPFGVSGITIAPHMVNETVKIGSVLVHNSSVKDLYRLLKSIHNEQIPDRLEISFNRIGMDLGGDLLSLSANDQQIHFFGTPLEALGCGDRQAFSPNDLVAMGYDSISMDTRFSYETNRSNNNMDFFVKFGVRDATSVTLEASIPSSQMPRSKESLLFQTPELVEFSVNVEDMSFNERRNKYCANLLGSSVDQFVDRHVKAVVAYLHDREIPVSEEVVNAYRRYVTESGNITIRANPLDPVGIMSFATLNARQLVDWLGLEVNISGKNIQHFLAQPVEEPNVEDEDNATPRVPPDTYKQTPVKELSQHVNRLLKVRTRDGKLHHAYLNTIDGDTLVLTREMVGGSATFTVPIVEIDEVRVLY